MHKFNFSSVFTWLFYLVLIFLILRNVFKTIAYSHPIAAYLNKQFKNLVINLHDTATPL